MCAGAIDGFGCVENAQFEQLTRVVPLVQRVTDIQALVALQTNEIGAECGGSGGRKGGFANSGLPLEEERPFQAERKKQRHRKTPVRHVMLSGQALLKIGNGFGKNGDASDGTVAEYNRFGSCRVVSPYISVFRVS
jgi:hypothetical protein